MNKWNGKANAALLLVVFSLCTSVAVSKPESISEDALLSSLLRPDNGKLYERALPKGVRESARNVYLDDLNGDGVPEVIVSLVKHPVNDCVSIYAYQAESQALSILEFEAGNICNLEKRKSYLVSTHRNGAKWIEDIYAIRDKEYVLVFTDDCIGCGWISRKEYSVDQPPVRSLVTDVEDFENRTPLLAEASVDTEVFPAPGDESPPIGGVEKGDEVKIMAVIEIRGRYFVEIESQRNNVKGWVKCEELDKCDDL